MMEVVHGNDSQTCHSVCSLKIKVEVRASQPSVKRTQPEVGRTALGTRLEDGITKDAQLESVGPRTGYA